MTRPLVGIDGSRLTGATRTGTENYTAGLLMALGCLDLDFDVRTYLNAQAAPDHLEIPGNSKCLPAGRFWTLFTLSKEMLQHRPDVLFVPAHVVPPVHPPSVVTIHDVGYRRFPRAYSKRRLIELDLSTRWSLRAASRIITVSSFSRDEIVDIYDIDPARIDVVHHGIDSRYFEVTRAQADEIRQRLNLNLPYLLSVGSIQPRKNLETLISAFEIARDEGLKLELVIAGAQGWLSDSITKRIYQSSERDAIRWLGYVDDADLPGLYAAADLFVFPSRYEGFGLPVLEAMAAGVPVLASKLPVLHEIAGDRIGYFAPDDAIELSGLLLASTLSSGESVQEAKSYARTFTWKKTALATRDVLKYVIDSA